MKNTIKKIAYSNCIFKFIYEFMRKVKNKLLAILSQLNKIICDRLPIKKNKIIFDNFAGQGYGGNPKYIAEEIIRQKLDWDLVWMVSDLNETLPPQIRKVKTNSLKSYFEWSTAKVWIDNIRNAPKPGIKKKGQVYLQTWHGSFICKPIEADAEEKLSNEYVAIAKKDGEITNALFSIVNFNDSYNRYLFWLPDKSEILHFGYPQYDVFFDKKGKNEIRERIRNDLNISNDTVAILYAPTFRDNGSHNQYIKCFETIIEEFQKKTSKKCVILVRLHPNDKEYSKSIDFNESIVDATNYPDSLGLSIATDFLISDYSSITYEFLLQKKPIVLYTPDVDEYINERGLYESYYKWPFPRGNSMLDLISIIKMFDCVEYKKHIDDFIQSSSFCIYDNGTAVQQTINWLKKRINQ